MRAIQQRVTDAAVGTVAAESALGMDRRRWLAESCQLLLCQAAQAASPVGCAGTKEIWELLMR